MSCYHPIYAVKIGTKENGKADLKMLGYRPDDRDSDPSKAHFVIHLSFSIAHTTIPDCYHHHLLKPLVYRFFGEI